ncbi:MAG: caspase family protein [Bacteroidales bacterium]|nr:caspase family protein [Bacteroidales bacterium]
MLLLLMLSIVTYSQQWSYNELLTYANKGEAWAQHALGNYYHNQRNYEKAFEWYQKSANQGYANGQYELAQCYEMGYGCWPDDKKAIEWYKKAADNGNGLAVNMLLYVFGVKYTPNPKQDNPTPSNNTAAIAFYSPSSSASTSYHLKAGIKSPSQITNVSVSIGRGFMAVKNDGNDFTLNKDLTLNQGCNTITVSVTNAAGTISKSLTVNVSSQPPVKPMGNRVALIIGNANYNNSPLTNPANDATAVAAKFRALGFKVTLKTDLTNNAFKNVLNSFKYQANNSEVAVVYYAGHGMEIDGKNYFIPVDATVCDDNALRNESVDAVYVLNAISGADKKVIILDACRNNPCRDILHVPGFGPMSATNAFFAYSTTSGKAAPDDRRYANALIAALGHKNWTLTQVFHEVSRIVTSGNKSQIPWTQSSLVEDVILNR